MEPDTYEQYAADKKAVGDTAKWLKEQDICQLTLWNNVPLLIAPPNFVELKIVQTDPGVRGDTAQGGVKPARSEHPRLYSDDGDRCLSARPARGPGRRVRRLLR